jgi:hypothetical protein
MEAETFFTRNSNPSTLTILISFTDRSMYMKILIRIGKFSCLLNFDFNNIIINNNIKKSSATKKEFRTEVF